MLSFGAISSSPISAIPDGFGVRVGAVVSCASVESEDRKLYAATEDYISRLADAPAGQPFAGTLDKLPTFDRSIVSGAGFAGLTNGFGDAGLINAEGLYDAMVAGYAVDGREVVFKAGDPAQPYAAFFEVARLVAKGITVDGQFLTLALQDKGFRLDTATQPTVYLGTGDLEGGSELVGKRRNMALGRVKGITPVLLIAGELLLEVNGGRAIQAVTGVYDTGYPLNFSANYATTAALRAAPIAGGYYATCLAEGRIRMGSSYSQITCDVYGDASGAGYVETTGAIIRRIIALTGCLSDPAEIDTASFASLDAEQPAPIGYYLDAGATEKVSETLSRLSAGIDGFCGFTRLGMLQAGLFKAPGGTPAAEYSDVEIIGDINVEPLPSAFDPPPWRVRVAYDRNWTVIDDPLPGLAIVDPERSAWVRTPYRVQATSAVTGANILDDHLQAQDPDVMECYFALAADALALASRRLALANSDFRLYRVQLKTHPFTHDICQAVRITDGLGRLGFKAGKLLRIAAISDVPDNNTIELRGFG